MTTSTRTTPLVKAQKLLYIGILGCLGLFSSCDKLFNDTADQGQLGVTTLKEMLLRLSPSEFHSNTQLDSLYYLLELTKPEPSINMHLTRVYRELGWRYVDLKNYGQGVVSFNMAIKTGRNGGETRDLIFALLAKGNLFESFKDYKEASSNYHEALEHSIEQKETLLVLSVYHAFSSMEIHRGDFAKARFFALKGIEIEDDAVKTNEGQRIVMQLYNDLGLGYQLDGIYPKAIQSFQEAITIDNRTSGNKAGFIYGNVGTAYGELQKMDSAVHYLQLDYNISEENNDLGSMYSSSISLADLYTNAYDYENALLMLNKSDSLRNAHPNVLNSTGTARLRVKLLRAIKSKDEQLKALNDYVGVLSHWLEENKRINEQQLRALVSINAATNRLEKLEIDNQQQEARKNRLTFFLVLAILAGLALGMVLYGRNRYLKQNARIDRLTLDAKKNEFELLMRDKMLQEKELSLQGQIVESRTKQLSDVERRHKQAVLAKEYIIDLKNKLIKGLLAAIEPVDQLPTGVRTKIEMAIRNISRLEENSFIQTFDSESEHADFSQQLQEKYPELSPEEVKLCTLLRLNMTTKEIARLKMITVAGVNKSRNRLRKKFQLKPEEDLNAFLMSI